jgi:hypothetical protein
MEEQLQEQLIREPQPVEYQPSKKELLKQNSIRIVFCSRGCLIDIGCKSIPFETIEAAMDALNKYINDPWNEQKKWEKILN